MKQNKDLIDKIFYQATLNCFILNDVPSMIKDINEDTENTVYIIKGTGSRDAATLYNGSIEALKAARAAYKQCDELLNQLVSENPSFKKETQLIKDMILQMMVGNFVFHLSERRYKEGLMLMRILLDPNPALSQDENRRSTFLKVFAEVASA